MTSATAMSIKFSSWGNLSTGMFDGLTRERVDDEVAIPGLSGKEKLSLTELNERVFLYLSKFPLLSASKSNWSWLSLSGVFICEGVRTLDAAIISDVRGSDSSLL